MLLCSKSSQHHHYQKKNPQQQQQERKRERGLNLELGSRGVADDRGCSPGVAKVTCDQRGSRVLVE
ncbi:hypothetical protein QJS10_CPB22g00236 [Acorus calamus]|uniref:Uncharacterized protein n=1 Tax=Acorus calamus TaxID=4465 RepID=A0AAV9BZ90_ACOCL|nr:hypothetical protein QJS10_CPB22g00236 [Acorus calamus]